MAFFSTSLFRHFRYRALVLLLVISGIMGLWFGLAFILATDRGLDLTDEGLYLLAADPPVAAANYGFPFGWHTGLLFRLVGYDISAFRTLGALVLVLAGGWLGWSAVALSVEGSFLSKSDERWLRLCGALTGALGSLLYYESLLSTPSYNWLNLFGLMIAAGGYLRLCNSEIELSGVALPMSFIAAAGLFLTIPAKPSSAPMLFVLGGCLLFLNGSLSQALRMSLTVFACVLACIVAAVLTGLWQWPVSDFFLSHFRTPSLISNQTLLGAIEEVVSLPKTYWTNLIRLESGILACFVLGASLLGLGGFSSPSEWRLTPVCVLVGLCLTGVGCLIVARATLGLGTAIDRGCLDLLVTGVLSLFITSAIPSVVSIIRPARSKGCWSNAIPGLRLLSIAVFLMGSSFVYGFGSGNTPYRMASNSVAFLLLGAAVLQACWISSVAKVGSSIVLLVVTALLLVSTMADAHVLPYRQKAIAEQTVPVRIGPHGAMLRLSPDIAEQLESLRQQAESAGWKPGMPLFGVVWRWASTIPYFLGAKVPDSLMLTIFGYPNSVQLAHYRIATALEEFPSEEAWILTSDSTSLDESKKAELEAVLARLSIASGRRFPDDYKKVAYEHDLELWKPLE